jgi:hypothetical protein
MCIEAKVEKNKDTFNFIPGETNLKLIINIPSGSIATESYATVRWSKKISEYILDTYIFGVEYNEIESDNQKMIEQHVLWLYKRPKVIFVFFIVLIICVVLLMYFGARLK